MNAAISCVSHSVERHSKRIIGLPGQAIHNKKITSLIGNPFLSAHVFKINTFCSLLAVAVVVYEVVLTSGSVKRTVKLRKLRCLVGRH